MHIAQTQCQVQDPQASNRATILLVVAHKVSKVARLKEACKHSKLAPNVRVESNTKQRFMLEPRSQTTVSQGPRAGKLSSKECLQQVRGSSTALGRSSVVEVLIQATVMVAIECPNKAAQRFWRSKPPSNGTRPQCKSSVLVVDMFGENMDPLRELVRRHVCTDP